jgi:methylated-DNA-[protein]-cysteine S-methyltransferase
MTNNPVKISFHTRLGKTCAEFIGDELVRLTIPGEAASEASPRHPQAEKLQEELKRYFESGTLACFTVPTKLIGTENQKKVWKLLREIPDASTVTYKELAGRAGIASVRAVGTMVGQNPLPIIYPCHRVVRADGKIGRYSCAEGSDTKMFLLKLERAR